MLATTAITLEEEAPPPLIDVDGTVLIQFGLFLVMLFVLSRFMFRPYLKLRDLRKEGIEGARQKAVDMDERAKKIVSDYEENLQKARQRGAEERLRLRQEGAARERQIVGAAREEVGRTTEAAKANVAKQAGEAKAQLDAQAQVLARQMASKILGREVA